MSTLQDLIADIKAEAKSAARWTGGTVISERVLRVMAEVPREEFVPPELRHSAFEDHPLPIGHGQTISQPYIVALMTELLQLTADDVVLDVGTGSGYQAAVLSRLAKQVYGLENVAALAREARQRLRHLGYNNVEVAWGNAFAGLPQYAPFDAILVAAAPERIPAALVEQLAPGGRLVVPVGARYYGQDLRLVRKDAGGEITVKSILPVAFVPLIDQILNDEAISP